MSHPQHTFLAEDMDRWQERPPSPHNAHTHPHTHADADPSPTHKSGVLSNLQIQASPKLVRMKALSAGLHASLEAQSKAFDAVLADAGVGVTGGGPSATGTVDDSGVVDLSDTFSLTELKQRYDALAIRVKALASANARARHDQRRRAQTYARKEARLRQELDEKSRELVRVQNAAMEDTRMSALTALNDKIKDSLVEIQERADRDRQAHEQELLTAFNARIIHLNMEMDRLNSSSHTKNEWMEKAQTLGKHLEWLTEQAVNLDTANTKLKAKNASLRAANAALVEEKNELAQRVVKFKHQAEEARAAASPPSVAPSSRPSSAFARPRSAPTDDSLAAAHDEIMGLQTQLAHEKAHALELANAYSTLAGLRDHVLAFVQDAIADHTTLRYDGSSRLTRDARVAAVSDLAANTRLLDNIATLLAQLKPRRSPSSPTTTADSPHPLQDTLLLSSASTDSDFGLGLSSTMIADSSLSLAEPEPTHVSIRSSQSAVGAVDYFAAFRSS